jgi:hypothetical protein
MISSIQNHSKSYVLSIQKYIMARIRNGDIGAVERFNFLDIGGVDSYLNDWTPLTAAIFYRQKKLAIYLMKTLRANVKKANKNGMYPIHYAAHNGFTDIVRLCLETPNANPCLINSSGKAPIHFAAQEGHLEVLQVLINHNAAVEQKNRNGETALDILKSDYSKLDKQTQTKCILFLQQALSTKKLQKNSYKYLSTNIHSPVVSRSNSPLRMHQGLEKYARPKKILQSQKVNKVALSPKQLEKRRKERMQEEQNVQRKSQKLQQLILKLVRAHPAGIRTPDFYNAIQKRMTVTRSEIFPLMRELCVLKNTNNHPDRKKWFLKSKTLPPVVIPQKTSESLDSKRYKRTVTIPEHLPITCQPSKQPKITPASTKKEDTPQTIKTFNKKANEQTEATKETNNQSVSPIQNIKEMDDPVNTDCDSDDGLITLKKIKKSTKSKTSTRCMSTNKQTVIERETRKNIGRKTSELSSTSALLSPKIDKTSSLTPVSDSAVALLESRSQADLVHEEKITTDPSSITTKHVSVPGKKRKQSPNLSEEESRSRKRKKISACGCWSCLEFGLKIYKNHVEGNYGPTLKKLS